ncbi:unnamed protein product [Linum tenue]|uniref:50S ribosomal protein L18, chloroplastic n=1 Tax=Linum tenue TaxID=586396 RepID=A0AAV0M2M3_9ROSI|nr:unnamed protein product [Linum tenue]
MATCSFTSNFLGFNQHQLSALAAGNPRPSSSIPPPSLVTVQAKARTRQDDRTARHARIRKKVEGTTERPRLSVYRSNKHFYVQVIDDSKMHTLAAASTMQKLLAEELNFSSGPTIVSVFDAMNEANNFVYLQKMKKEAYFRIELRDGLVNRA